MHIWKILFLLTSEERRTVRYKEHRRKKSPTCGQTETEQKENNKILKERYISLVQTLLDGDGC